MMQFCRAPVSDLKETLQERGRLRLLIIGHARHGKDTLAGKSGTGWALDLLLLLFLLAKNIFGLGGASTAMALLMKCLTIGSIIEQNGAN